MTASSAPLIVLIGAPGAGKTTVGRGVAARLDVDFLDTDAIVEQVAGKPVADIFICDGEQHFRTLEVHAVVEALNTHTGVLSLGGGVIMDPTTRSALVGHRVVWLNVGAADASKRVGMTGARPLLLGNAHSLLVSLLEQRLPLYEEAATVRINTDGRPIDAVVDEVVSLLVEQA